MQTKQNFRTKIVTKKVETKSKLNKKLYNLVKEVYYKVVHNVKRIVDLHIN